MKHLYSSAVAGMLALAVPGWVQAQMTPSAPANPAPTAEPPAATAPVPPPPAAAPAVPTPQAAAPAMPQPAKQAARAKRRSYIAATDHMAAQLNAEELRRLGPAAPVQQTHSPAPVYPPPAHPAAPAYPAPPMYYPPPLPWYPPPPFYPPPWRPWPY
jgi:hypothetical protein